MYKMQTQKKYDKNIYSNICEMYTLINFIIA
jgi:hypothetical protein